MLNLVKTTLYSVPSTYVTKKFPSADETVYMAMGQVLMAATNEYGQYKGSYPFFAEFPGSQLIEPYKQTTITLSGEMVDSSLYTFNWQIEGDEAMQTGTQAVIKVTKAGLFDISFHAYEVATGAYKSTFKTKLISK